MKFRIQGAYVWLNDHQMEETAGFTVAAFLNLGSAYPTMGQKSLTGEKDELASTTGGVWKGPTQREVKSDATQFSSDAAGITEWLGD